MLASLGEAPHDDPNLVYEPKYDGIRAIAEVGPREVRLWSRLGNEKTFQFPEVAEALARWARSRKAPVVLDGEIVALDAEGRPAGFQQLQGRIHEKRGREDFSGAPFRAPSRAEESSRPLYSTAFIAFDLLRDGTRDFRDRPFTERRAALERLFTKTGSPILRISEIARGDGRALYARALEEGWEGLIAKRADSRYRSGKRTPDWCKLKIVHEQEFVIGGWTEPRHTRSHFGALLLGVYDRGRLVYTGHTGTGFNERELNRLMALLTPLETPMCPFDPRPKTNERPHWVVPKLVAQIKFTEWTADGKLRHPVYLGTRDDKKPQEVYRETSGVRVPGVPPSRRSKTHSIEDPPPWEASGANASRAMESLVQELRRLEDQRRDGVIVLPNGDRLSVTNLHKVFWPRLKLTKGDLFRYYAEVAAFILPAVSDRPLVMKRFPNGIAAKPFYQHRATDAPPGVRVETVGALERRPQFIGGSLTTLLYMTQLAAISQDPWFSRVQSPTFTDHVALDLDPMPEVPFARVLDVARWIRDELDALGTVGFPKTSGSEGLHIYIPLPPETPYEAGLLFCQIVATVVAQRHPRTATIERAVKARGKRVYVDYLQNIMGKTLATAYSARASEYGGVSTPVSWTEIDRGVEREAFTIRTVPDRLHTVGDLWKALRQAKGADLSRIARYAAKTTKSPQKKGQPPSSRPR
jgi:bifunctional non-homologous end joining protein LigD